MADTGAGRCRGCIWHPGSVSWCQQGRGYPIRDSWVLGSSRRDEAASTDSTPRLHATCFKQMAVILNCVSVVPWVNAWTFDSDRPGFQSWFCCSCTVLQSPVSLPTAQGVVAEAGGTVEGALMGF